MDGNIHTRAHTSEIESNSFTTIVTSYEAVPNGIYTHRQKAAVNFYGDIQNNIQDRRRKERGCATSTCDVQYRSG